MNANLLTVARANLRVILVTTAVAVSYVSPASAQDSEIAAELDRLRAELADQRELIEAQGSLIDDQRAQIEQLQRHIIGDDVIELLRGRGNADQDQGTGPSVAQGQAQPRVVPTPQEGLPNEPVGVAPPEPERPVEIAAVPEGQGVLTPAGTFVLDPSLEYTFASTSRLVFRGIELVPGIQIGVIEASDADRETFTMTAAVRYGLTNRLEIEGRLPYLIRSDRLEVVQQREEGITREIGLEESNIGDAEVSLRYQLNRPRRDAPVWIASVRVKSDTGRSPFEIGYDEFGVATGLATGSGFWAIQPGMSFLIPSDPAVIYGGVNYLYHMPRDINRAIGDAVLERVDPGDSISANLGFGFALNPRFSFSLGYQHSYVMPTKTVFDGVSQRSNSLQVGRLNLGMSYRIRSGTVLNWLFGFGVTSDAPDVSVTLRVPVSY